MEDQEEGVARQHEHKCGFKNRGSLWAAEQQDPPQDPVAYAGEVPLLRQHQQGQEAVRLSGVRRSAQRKEALELPSSKVKPFQQSTRSSRREI